MRRMAIEAIYHNPIKLKPATRLEIYPYLLFSGAGQGQAWSVI
jgi:hypothetical protein